ncbi:DUF4291 domain-containing protein [Candidatus Woesearchaeota archaeon]|nr:DUF4291 domain-containing protein [Candidatus Woesearchaeota archaeon]
MKLELYSQQLQYWPVTGKHLLANFDKNGVIVYQAFKSQTAAYAVKNQHFGGPTYSFNRMSWIKPNFLWMMYRSGWACKLGQERILAIKLSHSGFTEILKNSRSSLQKANYTAPVIFQWDPDHDPYGVKQQRRAIQLGLRGEFLSFFSERWITEISDITVFVKEQLTHVNNKELNKLRVPLERIYPLTDDIKKVIGADN